MITSLARLDKGNALLIDFLPERKTPINDNRQSKNPYVFIPSGTCGFRIEDREGMNE